MHCAGYNLFIPDSRFHFHTGETTTRAAIGKVLRRSATAATAGCPRHSKRGKTGRTPGTVENRLLNTRDFFAGPLTPNLIQREEREKLIAKSQWSNVRMQPKPVSLFLLVRMIAPAGDRCRDVSRIGGPGASWRPRGVVRSLNKQVFDRPVVSRDVVNDEILQFLGSGQATGECRRRSRFRMWKLTRTGSKKNCYGNTSNIPRQVSTLPQTIQEE